MSDSDNPDGVLDSEAEITLGVLTAIEESSSITQRSVADRLGIALGLTNAYLKRCVRKGLVKVSQVPPNRYAYYLTPKGFAEKSRLTAEYLSSSFRFFRRARNECTELIATAAERGWRRLALYGASELAEIATLCAVDGVELVAIVDPARAGKRLADLDVVAAVDEVAPVDALLLTDLRRAQESYDRLVREMPGDRVLVPRLLGVKRREDA